MGDNNQVGWAFLWCHLDLIIDRNCRQASLLLRKQLAELNKNPVEGFSAGLIDDDDIYRWEVHYLFYFWSHSLYY